MILSCSATRSVVPILLRPHVSCSRGDNSECGCLDGDIEVKQHEGLRTCVAAVGNLELVVGRVAERRATGVRAFFGINGQNSGAGDGKGPRILFAAGGTGGHVYPALAIADEVKRLEPAAEIEFVGTKERMEWLVVPKAGYSISSIPAVAIRRPFWRPSNLLLPLRLLVCLWVSWKVVRKFLPDVVVGTGGYVAGPLCLMAALSGSVVAIQEQNAYAGITNRILGRIARVVFVSFLAASAFFPKHKCVLVGNPTRRVLQQAIGRSLALRSIFNRVNLKLDGTEEVIAVMGGSLGARVINEAVVEFARPMLEQHPQRYLVWVTGPTLYEATLARVGTHPRLALLPYIDAIEMMYAAADVVVARAGAITCSELLVTTKPAILIPASTVAEDHQMKNAMAMAEAGAATILPEMNLTAQSLSTAIIEILGDKVKQNRMQEAARKMRAPDAAVLLAQHEVLMGALRRFPISMPT